MEGIKRGSFGIPAEIKKHIEEDRRRVAANKPQDQPQAVPEAPPALSEAKPEQEELAGQAEREVSREEEFKKLKKDLEESLETTITADDIKDYIFKGRLAKEITIFKDVLKGTFRTLTATESMEIDKKMAEHTSKGEFSTNGLVNWQTLYNLSYSWVAVDGRPLSAKNDPAEREKFIVQMGAHTIDAATAKFNELNTLLKLVLQEKSFIKKS